VPRRRLALLAAALVAATVLAYLPLFANDFVAFDDDLYVTECPPVRAGLTREGLAFAFGSFHGANWFPLTRLSWMLDAELFGVEPRAFHATSLLLHCANAVLLLLALVRMTGAVGRSAFAAGVFALHPLHVESVAWAAARKDVLSGLFFLLALLLHARLARRGASRGLRAAIAACMAAGLLAKPIVVTLPLALLLLDAWPLGRLGDTARLRAALGEKAWLFALGLAAGVVAIAAQRAGGALQGLDAIPLGERLANAPVAALDTLRRAFWPSDLAAYYPHPRGALAPGRAWAAAAALAALTAAALRSVRRRPWLAVGWLWFLLLLAPVIGIVQVGAQAIADRYAYLPLVGLAIAVGWQARDLARGPRAERALAAIGLAALAACGVATWRQVGTWRDTQTLFARALAVTGPNAVAHVNLGLALARAGRLDAGLEHAQAALTIAPGLAHAHALLGAVRTRQGRHAEAIASYARALELLPGTARWEAEIGVSELELGRVEEGAAQLLAAARGEGQNASVLANAGRALERAGRVDEAIAVLREALRLRPDLAAVHGYLGAALLAKGELAEARARLAEAAAA
jgi:tetratricopeptide (TPR) repeat protein